MTMNLLSNSIDSPDPEMNGSQLLYKMETQDAMDWFHCGDHKYQSRRSLLVWLVIMLIFKVRRVTIAKTSHTLVILPSSFFFNFCRSHSKSWCWILIRYSAYNSVRRLDHKSLAHTLIRLLSLSFAGVHDIKLLLLRFAEEKSFHEDTGGGGPESNLHLIPYLIHTALYVLNTTRVSVKESNFVDKFLAQPPSEWKSELSTIEGVYYLLVVALMVHPPSKYVSHSITNSSLRISITNCYFIYFRFMDNRIIWLKRVMGSRGFRTNRFGSAEFSNYRPGLIFMGLIYGLYTIVFKVRSRLFTAIVFFQTNASQC